MSVMQTLALGFYSIMSTLFMWGMKAASPFFSGIRRQLKNRGVAASELREIAVNRSRYQRAAIFFCSSAGEYEQAKPVIEALDSGYYVHIFFQSASGYEYASVMQEELPYSLAPADNLWSWKRVFKAIRPDHTIIIRHEFWPAFVILAKQYSKLSAINIAVKENLRRSSWWMRRMLFKHFDHLCFVSDRDRQLVYGAANNRGVVQGNTKFDRAAIRRKIRSGQTRRYQGILDSISRERIFLIGSAWKEDVDMALNAYKSLGRSLRNTWTVAIAPHELNDDSFDYVGSVCANLGFSCGSFGETKSTSDVILIKEVGLLSELYGCCNAAMVGGGFRQGVHNVVEAAIYGVPIVSGPIVATDREAYQFSAEGGLSTVKNARELTAWLTRSPVQETCVDIANRLVQQNLGATQRIIDQLNL